jgi:hypothetical protein
MVLVAVVFTRGGELAAITELLKDPPGRESAAPGGASHEFVEFANLGTDTLFLDSLVLSDGKEADSVVVWTDTLPGHESCVYGASALAPGSIALILDPDYAGAVADFPASAYAIATNTVLLTVGDKELGDGLAQDDGVFLYKGTRAEVARLLASAVDSGETVPTQGTKLYQTTPSKVPEGTSVVPLSVLFDSPRYGLCPGETSPGTFEGLSDGWLSEWRLGRTLGADSAVHCTVAVHRVGGETPGAVCRVSRQGNAADTLPTVPCGGSEESGLRMTAAIPLDSTVYEIRVVEGATTVVERIDISTVWIPGNAIRVTEVFPKASADEPEWFEVTNQAGVPVNLRNWTYGNGEDADTLATIDLVVEPGAYRVFAKDDAAFDQRYRAIQAVSRPPQWHTLNNYRDTLVLWDAYGTERERIHYDADWFDRWDRESVARVSLESTGMTHASWVLGDPPSPGMPNGGVVWRRVTKPRVRIQPVPFTPNGDARQDLLAITLSLPPEWSGHVSVYGFDGRKVRTFAGVLKEQYLWDGREDNGQPAAVGPFFVVGDFADEKGKRKVIRKNGILWR